MDMLSSEDKLQIRNVYETLLEQWNANNAEGLSALFVSEGICIGFDGTEYTSADEIRSQFELIFKDHHVSPFVAKVRDVRSVSSDTAILRAVATMTPIDSNVIMPDRNTIHLLVAVKSGDSWLIASFQNTPARYDGRPEMTEKLSEELQMVAKN